MRCARRLVSGELRCAKPFAAAADAQTARQVARKYMPSSSIVIGIDLFPIKPIRGCITLVQDITKPTCRSAIKRHMSDWKVDVYAPSCWRAHLLV